MNKKVAIAGIFHETNTFVKQKTERSEFFWYQGADLLTLRGNGSPLDGVLEIADEKQWGIEPIIHINANPSGIVADNVIHAFWTALFEKLSLLMTNGIDGLYLVLHGAMVSESYDDVEGETLKRIREVTGSRLPICGVIDLHANFTPTMAKYSNGLLAYCKNPHTDAKEMARKAALLLDSLIQDRIDVSTFYHKVPIVWPPEGTGTQREPMLGLEAIAREFEVSHDNVFAVNIIAGFSFSDTTFTGLSFSIVSVGSKQEAEEIFKELAEYALANRHKGTPVELVSLDSVLGQIKKNKAGNGPVLLVEPSDNVGAGAPGDGTEILRFFISNKLENCAVIITDPQSVEMLATQKIGACCKLAIGGKLSTLGKGPVYAEVVLLKETDGEFELESIHSHLASMVGNHVKMGPSALLTCQGIYILLTSKAIPPFDLGQWKSVDLDPKEFKAIGIKAAIGHKHAYDPISKKSFRIDTPGVCSSNLKSLPYKKIKRPIFPLDEV